MKPLLDMAKKRNKNKTGGSNRRQAVSAATASHRTYTIPDYRLDEGMLMAPARAIPRLLARHSLGFGDIALWEIHEAFAAQVATHIKALQDPAFLKEKAQVTAKLGRFPVERMNPNGGSTALGHPFGATGARILSQAVKELVTMPMGSRAIVSICADGGLGSVALLQT